MTYRKVRRTVDKVVDGDTIRLKRKVAGSHFIRLAGINAPERGQRGFLAAL